jgi:hypothetical protein
MKEKNSPIVILQASQQPFLSIGVNYGGISVYGSRYKYVREHDAYVRHDYVKKIKDYKTWQEFLDHVINIQDELIKKDQNDTSRNT